ncbi:hypothetical protein [Flagellimonas sp. CMM7]|uniref:hypothetical protein n=1 Tax=Flagellimonas sp. CMM7 TaxID=2654676 RepID=UPI0013D7DD2B|nr:hypothetical protein [Flagellimonas sp. CMM7]UII80070.1 hypothetical protein LV704_00765 [Flagellimonas sp. CMM7]
MKFSTDIPPLHRLRNEQMFVSSARAARIIGKSDRWVRDNRHLFLIDEQGRNFKYELSSVLEYHFKELLS